MNKYTIYCTAEQTKKALALGAKLEEFPWRTSILRQLVDIDEITYCIPTAEQMISWLEEQDGIREININRSACYEGWYFSISGPNKQYITINGNSIASIGKYDSRKEATLIAIDVALEYLDK